MKRVVFETRVNPLSRGAAVAFRMESDPDVPASWKCIRKGGGTGEGSVSIESFDPGVKFSDEVANIYRDYCVYKVDESTGYRRTKENVVRCDGFIVDVDSHVVGRDAPMERIKEVVLSERFLKAVPVSMIVNTGNGYHLHFRPEPVEISHESVRTARRDCEAFEACIVAVHRMLDREFGLHADPVPKAINHNHRKPGTWNTKAMKSAEDFSARKPTVIELTRDMDPAAVTKWLQDTLFKYGLVEAPQTPGKETVPLAINTSATEVRAALSSIPVSSVGYDDWFRIGSALKSWDPEVGFTLWDAWSAQDADRYNAGEMRLKWDSLERGRVNLGTLFFVARSHGYMTRPAAAVGDEDKPLLEMFGASRGISETASEAAGLLKETGRVFMKGRVAVMIEGAGSLNTVHPQRMRSMLEDVAVPVRADRKTGSYQRQIVSNEDATAILACERFVECMPRIEVTTKCALLDKSEGGSRVCRTGYVPGLQAYSFAEATVQPLPFREGVAGLRDLIGEFSFTTPADASRAIAALLTPGFVFNRLIEGRCPAVLVEADQSQTGKGYFVKLMAALYGETPVIVTNSEGGVGKLTEMFDSALMDGHPIVSLDNIRGTVDSCKLESFLTEPSYIARRAYSPAMHIDPLRYVIAMTSNQMHVTKDLANRSTCVSLRKQERDFKRFTLPGGVETDLLGYIQSSPGRHLGMVYGVFLEWLARGAPRKAVRIFTAFREFWSAMEYILTEIFGMPSPTEDYGAIVDRVSNPTLQVMRELAIRLDEEGRLGVAQRAAQLLELAGAWGITLPFMPEGWSLDDDESRTVAYQAFGRAMSRVFGAEGFRVTVDGYVITRVEVREAGYKTTKTYVFEREVAAPTDEAGRTGGPAEAPSAPVHHEVAPGGRPPTYRELNGQSTDDSEGQETLEFLGSAYTP